MCTLRLSLLVVLTFMAACSSMRTINATPDELRRQIIAENILPVGETARIVTSDGTIHKIRVTEINTDERLILGKEHSIAIDEVIAVETKEFSIGKTALLAGGAYGVMMIVIAVGSVALLGAAG